ncbi:hypothetical protein LguiB_002673 [Lonicera macranthoides]
MSGVNINSQVPENLANLTSLRSLALEDCDLSGEFPIAIFHLPSLKILNVADKEKFTVLCLNFTELVPLSGPIPKGKQFDTFLNYSYMGNLAICGKPLLMRCGDPGTTQPLTTEEDDDSEFPSGVDWVAICLGLGSALVVGLIGGRVLTTRNHEWFVEKFEKRKLHGRRLRKRGQRN